MSTKLISALIVLIITVGVNIFVYFVYWKGEVEVDENGVIQKSEVVINVKGKKDKSKDHAPVGARQGEVLSGEGKVISNYTFGYFPEWKCDGLIEIEGEKYYPENLDEKFKVKNLEVKVDYEIRDENFVCGKEGSKLSFKKIFLHKIEFNDDCDSKSYDAELYSGAERKVRCYRLKVEKEKIGLDYCKDLSDSQEKDYCLAGLSIVNKDEKVCDMVESTLVSGRCYYNLAKMNTDVKLCSKILQSDIVTQGQGTPGHYSDNGRSRCFEDFVVMNPDLSYCDLLDDSVDKDACRIEVMKVKKDLSVCDLVEYGDGCFYTYALAFRDLSVCEKIGDDFKKKRCYYGSLTEESSVEVCDKVREIDRRGCIIELVKLKKDKNLCELFSYDEEAREACLYIYNTLVSNK